MNTPSTILNSFLQYMYITLREYPPPENVVVKCDVKNKRMYANKLFKSISTKLGLPTLDTILLCTKNSQTQFQNSFLTLTCEDIEKLENLGIIPRVKIDYSTQI